jgi:NADPH:quinone reductase-like Zn-dependent oxidoreductase
MPPTAIRKVTITAFGDPSNVKVVDDVLVDPPKNHVQIKVLYSGFSGADINMRLGVYPLQKKAPLTPGYCLVGRVHMNGPNCSKFAPGDLVCSMTMYDAEATYSNVAEKYLFSVPEGLDHQAATALILDWNTAYGMVYRAAEVKSGDKVFIHGMSGAVGYALTQLCLLKGAQVYGTASARNHDAIRTLGCTPFEYRNHDWVQHMKSLGGAQAVFDPLGFESWDRSYSILSLDGSVLIGYGGNGATLNGEDARSVIWPTTKLLAQNLKLCKRRTKFYYIDKDQKTFEPELRALFDLVMTNKVKVNIKKVVPNLDAVPKVHEEWTRLEGMGSVVVKVA